MEEKRNYKLYVHINKINNKKYYGITCQDVKKRWNSGYGYKGNKYFYRAIEKYGWNEGFEHIIIAKGLTKEEAKWLEIELIREFDTTNQDKGYNITLGGDGGNGHKHTKDTKQKISEANKGKTRSKETIKKMSEAQKGKVVSEETKNKISENMKGKNNPNYGREFSEEHKRKISESRKGKFEGENNPMYGKHLSQEAKDKLSEANDENKKAVYCIELDMTFESIGECSKCLECNRANISSVLHGRRKTCGGYHFIFAEELDNLNIKD